jgi:mono/diheme cytochrome c family protein
VLALLGVLAAGVAAGLLWMYSGAVDVAATSPHWAVTRWLLATARTRSIERHAGDVQPPASLDDPQRIADGAASYDEMCAGCHGAPGRERSEIAKGLNPAPPELDEEADEWSPAQVFWVVQHGIRMTGMPGFGPTHSDEALWQIVAFVERLPDLTPDAYRALARAGHHDEEGRHHPEDEPRPEG